MLHCSQDPREGSSVHDLLTGNTPKKTFIGKERTGGLSNVWFLIDTHQHRHCRKWICISYRTGIDIQEEIQ